MTKLRTFLCKIAKSVAARLEEPSDAIHEIQFQPAVACALRIASDAGWLDVLVDGSTHEAAAIIRQGQDVELLVRVFRILAAAELLNERGERQYQANRKTIHATQAGVKAGLAHWFDNMAPTFTAMPAFFKAQSYREPQDQLSGPYQSLFGKTYWDRLSSEPRLYDDLNTYMTAHKKSKTSLACLFPRDRLVRGFDGNVSDVLVVDVGGGKGHQLLELVSERASLPGRLVLEDLESVLPSEDDLPGIAATPHNFFEAQPVHGARYYYFSAILHDWPDHRCHDIIRETVKAMVPGYSRILLNGIILPMTGASLFEACKDFGMMAAMSAKERTLKQIVNMAESHGLQHLATFPGPKGRDGILEFELPLESESQSSSASELAGKESNTNATESD